jgi:dodecin
VALHSSLEARSHSRQTPPPGRFGVKLGALAIGPWPQQKGRAMTEHVYKVVEIVGSSEESVTKAIERAVSKAGETLRNLGWFEVMQVRGHLENGKVGHYQVTLKVGFKLEE